jgi:hypothetical protein
MTNVLAVNVLTPPLHLVNMLQEIILFREGSIQYGLCYIQLDNSCNYNYNYN